jgi:hypothetical protein
MFFMSPAAWGADLFVGAHAGALLGYGAEVGLVFDRLTVRGQLSEYDYDESDTIDDVSYELEAALDNRGVLLDYHLLGNGFFLSAGIYDNANSVNALGTPTADTVLIGAVSYDADDVGSLAADVDFGGTSPYFGLGWDFGLADKGFVASLEAGALFNGDADARLATVGGNPAVTNDPAFQAQLRQEEQELNDDLDDLSVLPVAKLGLRYYF